MAFSKYSINITFILTIHSLIRYKGKWDKEDHEKKKTISCHREFHLAFLCFEWSFSDKILTNTEFILGLSVF